MTTTIKPQPRHCIKFVRMHPHSKIPTRTFESAAYDLYMCDLTESQRPNKIVLPPHAVSRPIPTGIAIEVPSNYLALICSRSGLAGRGIFVANAPGIIDPDYRGELKVLLYNGGFRAEYVNHGERVAQLLVLPFALLPLEEVQILSNTERGTSGFGSSGA